jgi:hypothetical protein
MSGDSKSNSGPKLSIVRPAIVDPLDGSGAGDAPDGWYEPDRLGQPQDPPADPGRPINESRIIEHLRSVLSATRRDS